MITEE
jgi:predicted  nucleic acid-binding Zn-ribbon protein